MKKIVKVKRTDTVSYEKMIIERIYRLCDSFVFLLLLLLYKLTFICSIQL